MKKVRLQNGIGMAQIGPSKNTRPERVVMMWLVRNGIRHRRQVPFGRLTIDFVARDVAIEVLGRFWHCERTSKMRRMSPYWRKKLEINVARDKRKRRLLRSAGYRILTIWDTDLRGSTWTRKLGGFFNRG